jgi:predicted ATP-grasp superfamily ATP-dependent carboligase
MGYGPHVPRTVTSTDRWLRATRSSAGAAIVLGASVTGLSFVRSLSRRGIATLLLDAEATAAAHTRLAEFALLPSVLDRPGEAIVFLNDLESRLERPAAVFATSDADVLFLAVHGEQLGPNLRFLVPDRTTVETILDKRRQYQHALAAGVAVPAMRFVESAAAAPAIADAIGYPCIVKPCLSHIARRAGGKKLRIAQSPAELVDACQELERRGLECVIQEIVPGGDTALYGYLAVWDAKQRELAWVTKRKLRQYPPRYGGGSLQVSVDAPEVTAIARRLLATWAYRGFVAVELIRDARDGSLRLIEVNPRSATGNQLATDAGVDLPWIGFRSLMGDLDEIDAAASRFCVGVKHVHEEWDLGAFLALRRTGELTLARWLASLRNVRSFALGSWRDPMPLVVTWRRLLGRSLRRADDQATRYRR